MEPLRLIHTLLATDYSNGTDNKV